MSVIINDEHTGGTIEVDGLWVFTAPNGKVDLGVFMKENVYHCINYCRLRGENILLSRTSFGGDWTGTELRSWLVEHEGYTAEKRLFSNVEEMKKFISSTNKSNLEKLAS